MDMRGLTTFIQDIRKCQTKEGEQKRIEKELAKIRSKFMKGGGVSGYDRKKYVCKLLYIYMLGYEIDFGHMEAVNLLSSEKYSEKHLGYLACTLLLNEQHELITLITNSIKRDLVSAIPNFQCLALTAIANIGGKEFAESLAQDVQTVLTARETKTIVRKKAALCLLRLYQKYPEILPPENWSDSAIKLIGNDLGLSTSIMGLLLGLATKNPNNFQGAVPKVIRLLTKITITREYTNDYLYYGVPCPWLQIKLMRFLQYYPLPEDSSLAGHVTKVLNRTVHAVEKFKSLDKAKNLSKINSNHSVLFEALKLAIHYDHDKEILKAAGSLLGKYLTEKDANLRYLALDTMARLAQTSNRSGVEQIKQHQRTILDALRDADISIRRRALDLLYSMCDQSNAGPIVGELLEYLGTADFAIREELVLKIAILAEKFASDFSWYVDVILTLISKAGDFVSNEIWYRVVQIVTNNDEDLQEYAAKTVLNAVQYPSAHENAVKVAGYILGEFGHLIGDNEETSFWVQFEALTDKMNYVSASTKALLLNSFMKMFNICEDAELQEQIKSLLKRYLADMDSELQQRAVEYIVLAGEANEDLLMEVLDTMPEYQEGQLTSLIKKIKARKGEGEEGEEDEDEEDEDEEEYEEDEGMEEEANGGEGNLFDIGEGAEQPDARAATKETAGSAGAADDLMNIDKVQTGNAGGVDLDDLFGNETGAGGVGFGNGGQPAPAPAPAPAQAPMGPPPSSDPSDIFDAPPQTGGVGSIAHQAADKRRGMEFDSSVEEKMERTREADKQQELQAALADAENKFKNLCISKSGVAFQDRHLQLAIKSEFRGHRGRIALNFGNLAEYPLSQVRSSTTDCPGLQIKNSQVAPMISPKNKVQQYIAVECVQPFDEEVKLQLYFEYEKEHFRFTVPLPIVITKFLQPLDIPSPQEFFQRWNASKEVRKIFKAPPGEISLDHLKSVLSDGFNMAVLSGIDKPHNLVAAATLHTAQANYEILLRLQVSFEKHAFSLSVRSPQEDVAGMVHSRIMEQLE